MLDVHAAPCIDDGMKLYSGLLAYCAMEQDVLVAVLCSSTYKDVVAGCLTAAANQHVMQQHIEDVDVDPARLPDG